MKTHVCKHESKAFMKAKQSIQTYKNHMFFQTRYTFSVRMALNIKYRKKSEMSLWCIC